MAEKHGGDFGPSRVASGDLSNSQFRLLAFSGNDAFLPTSGAQCIGVQQTKARNDEHVGIIGFGYTKLILAGSLASGAEFMAGNNGFATLAASGSWTHGWLLTAGDSGAIVEAVVGPGYKKTV